MQTPEFGDCVGVESSADLKSNVEFGCALSRRHRRLVAEAHREYPPPISWLERTEHLPSHVPWVMKKYCSTDGRLIINEERVERREYFLADRSNGRLVLSLVHVDDVDESCEECGGDASEDWLSGDGVDESNGGSTGEDLASECYKYNGMGIKPCGGFVATAAAPLLRPSLHT